MCKLKLEFNPFIVHKTYKCSPINFPLILNEEQFLLEDFQVKELIKIYFWTNNCHILYTKDLAWLKL